MGADGAHVLGYGAALPGWHWLRLDGRDRAGCARGSVLGLNALGLVVIAYITLSLHQRLRMFSSLQQAGLVFAMVGINLMLNHWLLILTGQKVASGLLFLMAALTSAIIWPSVFRCCSGFGGVSTFTERHWRLHLEFGMTQSNSGISVSTPREAIGTAWRLLRRASSGH